MTDNSLVEWAVEHLDAIPAVPNDPQAEMLRTVWLAYWNVSADAPDFADCRMLAAIEAAQKFMA